MTESPSGKISAGANRFDALRLAFASFVFVYHIIALAALDIGGGVEFAASYMADIGVKGFFVISGALVYGSFQRTGKTSIYFSKRVRRLFPAYLTIATLPTFAALVVAAAAGDIVSNFSSIAGYFSANIVFLNFLHPEIPGFFDGNRFTAVNGALWTIKIEVMFYAIVPVIGMIIARLKHGHVLLFLVFIYAAGEAWRLTFETMADAGGSSLFMQLARQLPGQMAYFAAGMGLWHFRNDLKPHIFRIGAAGAIFFVLSMITFLDFLRPAAMAALVALAAWAPGPKMIVTRWGDLSYGVYITHFPIIQTLVAIGIFAQSPFLGVIAAIILVVASSLAMWRWIECPWLRKDSHYRQRASG